MQYVVELKNGYYLAEDGGEADHASLGMKFESAQAAKDYSARIPGCRVLSWEPDPTGKPIDDPKKGGNPKKINGVLKLIE